MKSNGLNSQKNNQLVTLLKKIQNQRKNKNYIVKISFLQQKCNLTTFLNCFHSGQSALDVIFIFGFCLFVCYLGQQLHADASRSPSPLPYRGGGSY